MSDGGESTEQQDVMASRVIFSYLLESDLGHFRILLPSAYAIHVL